jgi:antitoxin MazE
MKAKLIKVGNSRGVRLPKAVIDQVGLKDDIELEVQGETIVIRRAGHPRAGWEEACRLMAERGDDALIGGDSWPATRFDEEEWEW